MQLEVPADEVYNLQQSKRSGSVLTQIALLGKQLSLCKKLKGAWDRDTLAEIACLRLEQET